MEALLEELGLTKLEVKVYTMLLNEGPSLAGGVTKKTGIHRRNVYDCLERLSQKGLVGYIKENNRKVYSITHPEALLRKLEELQKEAEKELPALISKFTAVHDKEETLFFRGINGLKLIFEDQIKERKEILVNATTTKVTNILKFFFPKYQLLRKEKNIPTRMLFDERYQENKESSAVIRNLPLCKARYLRNFNRSPMSQYIYGNNLALVVWSDDPIAILIRQKEIAQGFRDSFELMWTLAKP